MLLEDMYASDGSPTTSVVADEVRFRARGDGAILLVVGGPSAGVRVLVNSVPVIAGSHSMCDLVVCDPEVSRQHFEAAAAPRGIEVRDRGSKNGTYVRGARIDAPTLVSFGEELRAGRTVFKVIPDERPITPEPSVSEQFGSMVARSRPMRQLFSLVRDVALHDLPVVILGETGVGKELVAEEIHRNSRRKDGPFVVFDCGVVPRELVESALFGHVKGAFTGATADRDGVFLEANGGTLFLDEIGELAVDLQPALLRALDRSMVRRVGESRYRAVDVRVVAATHRSLERMVAEGTFREDLYYRLAVVALSVPALRERREDIGLLYRHFAKLMGQPDPPLDESVRRYLESHDWPGNVRELRNFVARAVTLSHAGQLKSLVPTRVPEPQQWEAVAPPGSCSRDETGRRRPFRVAKAAVLEAFERAYLTELMADHDSITAAADDAGMDRKHLRTLLRRHGLHED